MDKWMQTEYLIEVYEITDMYSSKTSKMSNRMIEELPWIKGE